MKLRIIALTFALVITVFTWMTVYAEESTFSFETGVLNVPRVVTNSGDYATKFQMGIDSKFSLTDARKIQSHNIGDESINGTYKGVRTNFGTFNYGNTDTIIEIKGKDISVDLNSFLNGECRLSGSILDDYSMASGSYQCSDFSSGTWSSQRMNVNVEAEVLTAIIDFVPDGGGDYSSTVVGIEF